MVQDDSLERRMARFSEQNIACLVSELKNPARVYSDAEGTKADLAEQVVGYFREKMVPFKPYVAKIFSDEDKGFASKLYNLTKECLAVAAKGTAAKGVPAQFLRCMEPYEKVYFLAGVCAVEEYPKELEQMNAFEISSFYIRAGIDAMSHAYYSLKKSGKRKGHVRLPYSKTIRRRLKRIADTRRRINIQGRRLRQVFLW